MNTFVLHRLKPGRIGAAILALAGLAGSVLAQPQPQPLLITTVAGYPGKGSTDGSGNGALFNAPQSVATDAAGNIYVADTGNNTIRVVTSSGVSSTLAGSAGVAGSLDGNGTNALFNQPCGIALDAGGSVYVSDFASSVIRKITSGQVTTIAGKAGVTGSANNNGTNATFFHPMGLAIDTLTNIYVADYGNQLIRKISSTYAVSTLAGSAGIFGPTNGNGTGAQFYNPEALTVDPSGNVYVADTGNAVIRMITSGGNVSTLAGSPGSLGAADGTGTNAYFYQPEGIVYAGNNTLYVSDFFNNTIRSVSTSGAVLTIAGLPGTQGSTDGVESSARFWAPQGLAINTSGILYFADTGNSEIRAMTSQGVVSTLAGSPSAGSTNGVTSAARFYSPENVAIDTQSNVYVADTANSVIRKISPIGVVSIFAGNPGVTGSTDGMGSNALFSAPQGIAVDSSGNVYVADTGNSTIREISTGGISSTIAGSAGNPGNSDGAGTNAQFNQPEGVTVDSANNIYVADTFNQTIRKITSGVSSTLAGLALTPGSFDGTNGSARFNNPTGIVVNGSGTLFVTDFNNDTIRQVTPSGIVTTIAGWSGIWGTNDGTWTNASFFGPAGISLDSSGNLYVIDSGNQTLRALTVSGTNWTSTTIAGSPDVSGIANGLGSSAQFNYPAGVAVSSTGYIYVADAGNNTIRSQAIPPSILTQPQSQTAVTGSSVVFSVAAYGSTPFIYIWNYNGTNYLTTGSSSITTSNAGSYSVTVSNLIGQAASSVATLVLTNNPPGAPGVFQTVTMLPNGTVQFSLTGTSGATYTLQGSTNLPKWYPLITFTMTNGAVQITDTTAPNYPAQFYELVSP